MYILIVWVGLEISFSMLTPGLGFHPLLTPKVLLDRVVNDHYQTLAFRSLGSKSSGLGTMTASSSLAL